VWIAKVDHGHGGTRANLVAAKQGGFLMSGGGTADVPQQRRIVHVGHVLRAEPHLVSQPRGKQARTHRIFGRLAMAEIGDDGESSKQVG
jgi:hypothetical protein